MGLPGTHIKLVPSVVWEVVFTIEMRAVIISSFMLESVDIVLPLLLIVKPELNQPT